MVHPHPSPTLIPSFFTSAKRNLIGKDWLASLQGKTCAVSDPSTGRLLMTTPDSTVEDVNAAVTSARRAFEGSWRRMTPYERARVMLKIADLIESHSEELAAIEAVDAGKPIQQARYVDVPLALHQFRFFAGVATQLGGRTITPSTPYMAGTRFHAYTVKEPVGVVGAITPFNFPLLLGAMKIAPALAAGCTLILKPDERAPGSLLRLAELALEAGLPEGVLNLIIGGPEAGHALAAHAGVDKIAFTGSSEAGRSVLQAASGNLKKVSLELGGNSPNIICKDADVAAAIEGSAGAAFTNAGECCVSGARLFVEEAVYDRVMEGLVEKARSLKLGACIDESTTLGPLITQEHLDKVMGYVEGAHKSGAKLLTGGRRVPREGFFVEPTLVADAHPDSAFVNDEVFGPVVKVQRFRDIADLTAEANRTPYGLAAGVWTRDVSKAHALAAALKAGTVWVNCYNVFDTALPFGGYKQSGWGRESCPEAVDLYTEVKTVCLAL